MRFFDKAANLSALNAMSDKENHRAGEKLKAENDRMKRELRSVKKENAALRRALNHRENMVQGLPLGLMVIQGEKIIDANGEMLAQLGYTPQEVLHHDLKEFVPGRQKKLAGQIFGKGRAGKPGLYPERIELICKDGASVEWDIKVQKIRSNGRNALLAMLTRNEQRKKKEKDLMESVKAGALHTMASGLRAALEDPLRSLRAFGALAKQSLGPAHEKDIRSMEEALLRLEKMGRAMECFTKEIREPRRRVAFDLRKVVKDALGVAGLRAREEAGKRAANIKVKTYLRSVSPLEGDPDEIRQMLSHVLSNAVDAMSGGGDLYLSTEENAGYAHIYIQDSGTGIAPQVCEQVIDPFFTTKGPEKTGLGLSLCRAIVRRHRGEMEISSRKNEGTMVTVRLPLAKHEGQGAPKQSRKKGMKHARILVIEDTSMIGELLLQALKSKGCGVEIAASATEGLAQVRRKAFDLVIVGAAISDLRGESLVRRIKQSRASVPVALISDHYARERRDAGRPPFADLVITKPIDMSQTIERIAKILRHSR